MFEKSSYVLTIQKRNQYIEIQDGSYLVGFGMVWLFGFGIHFERNSSSIKIFGCAKFEQILQPRP